MYVYGTATRGTDGHRGRGEDTTSSLRLLLVCARFVFLYIIVYRLERAMPARFRPRSVGGLSCSKHTNNQTSNESGKILRWGGLGASMSRAACASPLARGTPLVRLLHTPVCLLLLPAGQAPLYRLYGECPPNGL